MADLDDVSGATGSSIGTGFGKYTRNIGIATGIVLLGFAGSYLQNHFFPPDTTRTEKSEQKYIPYNRCTEDPHGLRGELEVICFTGEAWIPRFDKNNKLVGMDSVVYELVNTGNLRRVRRR